MKTDNVIVTVAEIVEHFGVNERTVRSWIENKRLVPVRREGVRLYFSRGEVSNLVYAICPVCGCGFQRAKSTQRFCGRTCRQRWARLHKGEPS